MVVGHLICISFFIHVAKPQSWSPRNSVYRSLSRDRVTCILNYILDDDDDDDDGDGDGQEYEYEYDYGDCDNDDVDVLIVEKHNTSVVRCHNGWTGRGPTRMYHRQATFTRKLLLPPHRNSYTNSPPPPPRKSPSLYPPESHLPYPVKPPSSRLSGLPPCDLLHTAPIPPPLPDFHNRTVFSPRVTWRQQ